MGMLITTPASSKAATKLRQNSTAAIQITHHCAELGYGIISR
jgi:hypothetical protein